MTSYASATTTNSTETAAQIEVRRMDFGFDQVTEQDWFRNNPILSAFMAVLSGTFPPGEQMFIQTVRYFKDDIKDPELQEAVRLFTQQEAHHTHQHKLANQRLEELGWKALDIEWRVERAIQFLNKDRSPENQLAMTVCLEHLTAIVAEFVLTHPEHFDGMDPAVRNMLIWHAIEEIEHKSVAFDVYMQVCGDRKALRKMMNRMAFMFPFLTTLRTFYLLARAKRLPRWKHIRDARGMLTGPTGMLTCLKQPLKDFYGENFHPDDHDNRGLVEKWKAEVDQYRAV